MAKKIRIGVSFSETKYPNYPAWILDHRNDIEIVELSWEKQNLKELYTCNGLLLTGGIDIDPFFFQPQTTSYPNQPIGWNRLRDQFEIELFNVAQSILLPVLGICRGLQLVNVALKGDLLIDIQMAGKQNHRAQEGIDHVHAVQLVENSLLASVSGIKSGLVNSAHHQAIGAVAAPLLVNCFAEEDVIEGIEWKDKEGRCPMLCVQWHPERIENKNSNPLSQNIKEWFLNEAAKFLL